MRRIAIINQKGGVGKTTTTANLGAAFARAGQRVLLIDLDPQGHLSLHFGVEVGDDQATVYDVLTSGVKAADALVRPRENIALIPADIDLAAAEAELVSVTGREVLLREAIDALSERFDLMIIDCPPSLGVLTINALVASREVIIPLQAHFFGLQGLSKLLDTVLLVRQRINPALTISGIALCMHEASTKLAAEVADDLGKFLEGARGTDKPWAAAQLYRTAIRRNIKLAESSSFGQTVFDYASKSNGAVDYANLAAEILPTIDAAAIVDAAAATPVERIAATVISTSVPEPGSRSLLPNNGNGGIIVIPPTISPPAPAATPEAHAAGVATPSPLSIAPAATASSSEVRTGLPPRATPHPSIGQARAQSTGSITPRRVPPTRNDRVAMAVAPPMNGTKAV